MLQVQYLKYMDSTFHDLNSLLRLTESFKHVLFSLHVFLELFKKNCVDTDNNYNFYNHVFIWLEKKLFLKIKIIYSFFFFFFN